MAHPEAPITPFAEMSDTEKDDLLDLVSAADEVSSIFLKETHEEWIAELMAVMDVQDITALRALLDARIELAEVALRGLLARPGGRIELDLGHLGELFNSDDAVGEIEGVTFDSSPLPRHRDGEIVRTGLGAGHGALTNS